IWLRANDHLYCRHAESASLWLAANSPRRSEGAADAYRTADLRAWGEGLLEHVLADLEAELRDVLARPAPTPLEEFVEHRRRGFVGREDQRGEARALLEAAAGEGASWGLCLTGEPGSGKSSFFAELYHRLGQCDGLLVLAHAAGSEPGSERVDALLRGWVG